MLGPYHTAVCSILQRGPDSPAENSLRTSLALDPSKCRPFSHLHPPPLPPPPVYVFISHRLFQLTLTLKDAAVPHDNNRTLLRNLLLLALMLVVCTALGWVVHTVVFTGLL